MYLHFGSSPDGGTAWIGWRLLRLAEAAAMGGKIYGVALSAVVPTEEERGQARQTRESMNAKMAASAKTTVWQFLGKFPDEETKRVRGNDKLLDLYLVHFGRTVHVDKSITNDRTFSKDKKNTKSSIDMAKRWDAKRLAKPDSITG